MSTRLPRDRDSRFRRVIWLEGEVRRKQIRYFTSSAASVVVGEAVLAFTFGVLKWSAVPSNVVSFIVAGMAAYSLHRRWTWRRTERSRVLTEILPYSLILLVSLAVSTWAVDLIARESWKLTSERIVVTGLMMTGALVVNGMFWVIKYRVFDRYLFVSRK